MRAAHIMRKDTSSSEGLAAMLASSSSTMFQGFEEAMVAGVYPKRKFYYISENSDEIIADDEAAHHVDKKRRLTADQVKSLEKNFEVENKLEPERKLQLARELGLQPRQVAIWFQNRRARWKIKQLEKDFDILMADYDALKCDYEAAIQEKEKLQAQILRLNERFRTGDSDPRPLPAISTLQQPQNIFTESTLQRKNQTPNEIIQSNLDSQMSPLPLPVRKRGSSSSNSDNSEVLDAESPPMEHPILSELANNLGSAVPSSSIIIGEEDYEKCALPLSQTQRSIAKIEDVSNPAETSNFLFSLDDPITGFSWWDWT